MNVDHEARRLADRFDASGRVLVAKIDGVAAGTIRLNMARDTDVSADFRNTCRISELETHIGQKWAYSSRLATSADSRGGAVLQQLADAHFELALREEVECLVLNCTPALVHLYEKLGCRRYAAGFSMRRSATAYRCRLAYKRINDAGVTPRREAGSYDFATYRGQRDELARLEAQAAATWSSERALLTRCGLRAGICVLDLGCRPGFLTRHLAKAIGPSGAGTGLDVSPALLATARTLAPDADAACFLLVRILEHQKKAPGSVAVAYLQASWRGGPCEIP